MSAQMDCPICMEVIEVNKNCVTTECGHCFHANCLMTSVAHNGFGCPYCRTAMAEIPAEEIEYDSEEEDELYDDNVLRGFRFFFNNVNGQPHEEEDINEEEEEEEQENDWSDVEDDDVEEQSVPSTEYVVDKLRQRGITYEQLVKSILFMEHNDEYDNDELKRNCDELFGKFRIIISNYRPEDRPLPEVQPPNVSSAPSVPPIVDYEAQPKRRINLHSL